MKCPGRAEAGTQFCLPPKLHVAVDASRRGAYQSSYRSGKSSWVSSTGVDICVNFLWGDGWELRAQLWDLGDLQPQVEEPGRAPRAVQTQNLP